jgi:hypothetical protein
VRWECCFLSSVRDEEGNSKFICYFYKIPVSEMDIVEGIHDYEKSLSLILLMMLLISFDQTGDASAIFLGLRG